MVRKGILFLGAFLFLVLVSLSYVSAVTFEAALNSSKAINRSLDNQIHINITAHTGINITMVNITLPAGLVFTTAHSNRSSNQNYSFSNVSDTGIVLTWTNITNVTGDLTPGPTLSVYFNVTPSWTGEYNITVRVRNDTATQFNTKVILINAISTADLGVALNNSFSINRSTTQEIRINITAGKSNNVTLINISIPSGITLLADSNITSDDNFIFSNSTHSSGVSYLVWKNLTTDAIGPINTSFLSLKFNVSAIAAGVFNIYVNITNGSVAAQRGQTILPIGINFAFSGYVKNETGNTLTNATVLIYKFEQVVNGPPLETLEAKANTTQTGLFHLPSINGSAPMYKIKVIYYNASGDLGVNAPVATKVSSVLPPFPATIYYPGTFDMSLNGSIFYLQPAATLRLYANTTSQIGNDTFGYEVIDQKVGFPVESNLKNNISTVDVVVPTGKDYTVMMLREPSKFPFHANCDGKFFNQTNCPSTPKSNSSFGTLTAGSIVNVTINLTMSKIQAYGCINVAPGHWANMTVLNSSINITNMKVRLLPWAGFVTPMEINDGKLNIQNASQLNTSASAKAHEICNGTYDIGFYNVSVLASSTYLIEVYAKNASNEGGGHINSSSGTWTLSGVVNFTTGTGDINYSRGNITLYRLLGAYLDDGNGTGQANTTLMKISIRNETGGGITENLHVNVKLKHPTLGTMTYIIETLANGSFYFPILNNTEWVRVMAFANNAPPISKDLNLSLTENNITLVAIDFGSEGDKGLRQMNSSGQLVAINNTATPFELRFLKRGTGDIITNMSAGDFNPLKALVAGMIDLEIKVASTGVTMRFNNFDMFSAKQPPMFAVMDNAALTSSGENQKRFGNFVPKEVYDNVTIKMSYDTSLLNESWNFNISIPVLYKEDPTSTHQLIVAWNRTAGNTDANLSDYFIEYNASRYRAYLTSVGAECSKTNTSAVCYMNTSGDTITMEIPHFSGLIPLVAGTAPAAAAAAAASTTSGSSTTTATWSKTVVLTDEQFTQGETKQLGANERVQFKVSGATHQVGVKSVSADKITIEVSSTPQQATLAISDVRRFEVTNDSFYDVQVTLNSIAANKADLTIKSIHEEITAETEAEEAGKEAEATGEVTEEEAAKTNLTWWIIGALILVIIVVVIIVIAKKRR